MVRKRKTKQDLSKEAAKTPTEEKPSTSQQQDTPPQQPQTSAWGALPKQDPEQPPPLQSPPPQQTPPPQSPPSQQPPPPQSLPPQQPPLLESPQDMQVGGGRGRGAGRGKGRGQGDSGINRQAQEYHQPPQQPTQQPVRSHEGQGRGQRGGRGRGDGRGVHDQYDVAGAVQKMQVGPGGDAPLQLVPQTHIARIGGTECKFKTRLITNHFPLILGTLDRAIHYDVAIVPDKPKKMFRAIMERFRQKKYKNRAPAYDGNKNLYSVHKLFDGAELRDSVEVPDEEGKPKCFEVTIKFATNVDLTCLRNYVKDVRGRGALDMTKPMQALQCIEVVLRSAPALTCIPAGRSYFTRPQTELKLGDGCVLYHGFYQAAILGWKPFVNIDIAHKAFPAALNMIDLVEEITKEKVDQNTRIRDRDRHTINKHIKQLKVEYVMGGNPATRRIYRVNELDSSPRDATFKDESGKVNTVENYFKQVKNTRLKYPNLPTLWVGAKSRRNKILLPMEFCTIVADQVVNKKMTENQTRNMIKEAATNTETRRKNIEQSVIKAGFDRSPSVKEFGISVDSRPQEVEGRILNPPILQYNQQTQTVFKGTWRANKFMQGAVLKKWTVLCLDSRTRDDNIQRLAQEFMKLSREVGMSIALPTKTTRIDDGGNLQRKLSDYFQSLKNEKFEMVVVILSMRSDCYNYVKQASEIMVGCLTQCLKPSTVYKLNTSTVTNILLKINAKLNGENHHIRDLRGFLQKPCMIMGADVTHPGPENRDLPSVAAVTASFDVNFFKYAFQWRLQPSCKEMIEDLEEITREHLLNYYRKNNKVKPEKIIYVRDGVSDGQFVEVLNVELNAIRSACQKLQASYQPSVVFIVVQKRHHTRFFPKDTRISEDRNLNVPAGTCVDTEITHPSLIDFYLVSHASIQGVAKPTKYVKLWDDCNMSEDEVEKLMYYLCHIFARCNRSVSYPAPTYYAHLAAARARVYCEIDRIDMSKLQAEQKRLTIKDDIIKDLPMFFV